jgi:UDP-N-acetylglucosamine--N-acetylmuramyl-(pentapeptide) pyrophosphoryl-undecaprenol N-acetylglucosamine transferase
MADDLIKSGIQLIWQTGKSNTGLIDEMKKKNIGWIEPFIDAMEYAYAAADVVICRAGATTLAELTRLGKAAILVPYPYAAEDHQTFNAKTLVDAGAATMITDRDVQIKMKSELLALLNDDVKRQKMSQACRFLGKPNAGAKIAATILEILN